MMEHNIKFDFPVSNARHFLEPGPVVLVTSKWQNKTDIMTMGWHMVMEFSPSLIGCIISSENFSHSLIRRSSECVINIPPASLIDTVVGIGNSSGEHSDKFSQFELTPTQATKVDAPIIEECHASFECRLYDDTMIEVYNMFIFEIVKGHASPFADKEKTIHYQGMGQFIQSGKILDRNELFKLSKLN